MRLLLTALLCFSASVVHAQANADCSTPRRAVDSWLGNLQPSAMHPDLAVRCFDWNAAGVAPGEREEVARNLKAILDQRGFLIDMDALADTPEVEGLDRGKLYLRDSLRDVYLTQVDDEWRISAHTIRHVPDLYEATFHIDVDRYVERFPSWMRVEVLGVAIWQLLGLLIGFVLGLLVRWAFARFGSRWTGRLLRMRGQSADTRMLQRTFNPLGTMAFAAVLWWTLALLRFPVRVNQVGAVAVRVVAAMAAVLLLYRLVDLGADVFARRAERTDTKFDDQIVPLVRKTLKVFVVVVGVIFVLQNLDIDVGSLLAGVSLGGLAFTLAAKDTVANLFGSVSIFADQPFQVGDWVDIDGHEGIVEEVGMRSTRVRTFYNSLITIPNSVVANAAIDNYGLRRYRRCMVTLGLTYDTTPDQVQAFVEGVRAILRANPHVRQDAFEVAFRNFGDSALEVLLYFFFDVPSWTEELKQRQNVFLEVMRLASAIGVEFAFPTQTLHVESRTAPAAPERALVPREKLAKVVDGFGPKGDLSTAESPLLTQGYWPLGGPTVPEGE
ncbi:MAG: mechanosensitive ion channel family protein [Myxococcota bacterium]